MLLVHKFLAVLLLVFPVLGMAKSVSVLVVGQSISSNCNDYKFSMVAGVKQVDLSGQIVPAVDPFAWADCKGGAVWIPMGKQLVIQRIYDEVIFMPIGVSGSSVKDWLPNGRAHEKLKQALRLIKDKKIKIDYIFWYQGSSDMGGNPYEYRRGVLKIYAEIKDTVGAKPMLVARHSRCGAMDKKIEMAQNTIISSNVQRYFAGPNTNDLDNKYRMADLCHLNKLGQEKVGEMWAEALLKAINAKEKVEDEILIKYFRW